MSTEEFSEKNEGKEYIYVRSYSKVVFFYPLLFVSLTLWIIELVNGISIPWVGTLWMIIFFSNLFVIAFDVSSTSFVVLVFIVIIAIILIFLFIIPNLQGIDVNLHSQILMSTDFYMWITIILAIAIGIAIIKPLFHFWIIQSNEVINKRRLFGEEKRYPTRYLRVQKAIPDVFEYLLLRAGSLSLIFQDKEAVHLNTVPNINKKSEEIDKILGKMEVQVEDQVP